VGPAEGVAGFEGFAGHAGAAGSQGMPTSSGNEVH